MDFKLQWGRVVALLVEAPPHKTEVAGPIPDGVIDTSRRTMFLGSTQTANKYENQRHFLGVKAAGA